VTLDFIVWGSTKMFLDLGEILEANGGVISSEGDNLPGQNELTE